MTTPSNFLLPIDFCHRCIIQPVLQCFRASIIYLDSTYLHTVLLETDIRRSEFVVIFFQLTQNWTALNFEVNFRPLIQWDSRGLFSKSLMKLGDRLMTSKSERQRTSGPQKRSKSDFMYCCKFTLRPARSLVKEFRVVIAFNDEYATSGVTILEELRK